MPELPEGSRAAAEARTGAAILRAAVAAGARGRVINWGGATRNAAQALDAASKSADIELARGGENSGRKLAKRQGAACIEREAQAASSLARAPWSRARRCRRRCCTRQGIWRVQQYSSTGLTGMLKDKSAIASWDGDKPASVSPKCPYYCVL